MGVKKSISKSVGSSLKKAAKVIASNTAGSGANAVNREKGPSIGTGRGLSASNEGVGTYASKPETPQGAPVESSKTTTPNSGGPGLMRSMALTGATPPMKVKPKANVAAKSGSPSKPLGTVGTNGTDDYNVIGGTKLI